MSPRVLAPLALAAAAALLTCPRVPAVGPDMPAEWATIRTPFYRLHHAPGLEADAKAAGKHLDRAIESLKKDFEGHPVAKLLGGIECDIYLHPKPGEAASEGFASLRTEGLADGGYRARIDWLTPSAFRPDFRSGVGEPPGDDYFAKVLVHEYGTILLDRITRAKPKGWRFYSAPAWFVQGYEEYLGLTHSTPRNRGAVLGKYLALQKQEADRVRIGFGIGAKDPYLDGAALLHFMHEAFGRERVQAILTSEADSFETAAGPALGVTLEEFGRKWGDWRKRLP